MLTNVQFFPNSRTFLSCVALFASVLPLSVPAFGAAGAPFEVTAETMSFKWKVEGNRLNVTLRAKTTGWLGFGFNASNLMKDGIFFLAAEKDGKVKVESHYGTSERAQTPFSELGCKENISNAKGKMDGEFTEISFTVITNATDKCSKPINVDGDTKLMLAYGSGKKFTLAHPFKAKMLVNLKTGAKKPL